MCSSGCEVRPCRSGPSRRPHRWCGHVRHRLGRDDAGRRRRCRRRPDHLGHRPGDAGDADRRDRVLRGAGPDGRRRLSVRGRRAAASIASAVVLSFLSGLFGTGGAMPGWLTSIAEVFPLKAFHEAVQAKFDPFGTTAGWDPGALALLTVWGVAAGVVAVWRFGWEPGVRATTARHRRAQPVGAAGDARADRAVLVHATTPGRPTTAALVLDQHVGATRAAARDLGWVSFAVGVPVGLYALVLAATPAACQAVCRAAPRPPRERSHGPQQPPHSSTCRIRRGGTRPRRAQATAWHPVAPAALLGGLARRGPVDGRPHRRAHPRPRLDRLRRARHRQRPRDRGRRPAAGQPPRWPHAASPSPPRCPTAEPSAPSDSGSSSPWR